MNFTKTSPKLTACLFTFLLGAVGTLAYSPFDIWIIAYVSAFGLLWAVTHSDKKTALWATFAWSMGTFCVGINWVSVSMTQFGGVPVFVSYLAVGLLSAYLAIYNLIFCWISQKFSIKNPFILASIFTFTEYLRGVVFTGFPWLQFGYTQINSPFYGIAPILGVEGLTFFVIVVSGYLLQIFCKYFAKNTQDRTASFKATSLKSILIPVTLSLIVGFSSQFLNWIKINNNTPPTKISLIQGNIPQQMKWDPVYFYQTIQTYKTLVRSQLEKSDVVILPESAFPAMESKIEPLLQQLQEMAMQTDTQIIVGTLNRTPFGKMYNSAVMLGNLENLYTYQNAMRYNKHHLVPFGEYVPFGDLLDWMRDVFILPINLSRGDFIQTPLYSSTASFNLAICYEIIFGHQLQQNQKAHHPDYLLTISNDAWFGESIGPWQHLQMARMRALELGKPLIRATNTGVTAFVDPYGNITTQAPQFKETTLYSVVQKTTGETPFTWWGNWLIYGLSFLLFVFDIFRRYFYKK